MPDYPLLKLVHVVSATVLFGTGLGTAFHMWRAHRTGDVRAIAAAARSTVHADWLFTTPAVILQPLTGIAMIQNVGWSWTESWIAATLFLYVVAGVCWVPVVWLQLRMRDLAAKALLSREELPHGYARCFRWWFGLGWPAFISVTVIFYLMVYKPSLW